jgi:hypothetical protein
MQGGALAFLVVCEASRRAASLACGCSLKIDLSAINRFGRSISALCVRDVAHTAFEGF